MRIVLHAGLHKSGTTTIQSTWKSAYADPREVWYPPHGGGRAPGHHGLLRPLLSAFRSRTAPDLVAARARFDLDGHAGDGLARTLARAAELGTRTLLLSAEDLDRVQPEDRERLAEAFRGHTVAVVVTATRPVHRWCSGWQTLVKHGLALYPSAARGILLDFAALRPGRLAQILELLPGAERTVRLVRSTAPEPDLAGSVAEAVGLPLPAVEQRPRNASLGRDTEILRRINQAGLALGNDQAARSLLATWHARGVTYQVDPALAAHYALPDEVRVAAETEAAWLTAPTHGVRVLDPHGARAEWLDESLPGWYAAIAREEAVIPELDEPEDPALQLWRVRQEREVLRRRLARTQSDPSDQGGAPYQA